MSPLRRAATPALASVLVLAACAGPATEAEPELPALPAATSVDLPATDLDLGAIAPGTPASATLTGPAAVGFSAPEDSAVIADLDCSACTGNVQVASPGWSTPWGQDDAPVTGQYLVVMTGEAPDRVEVQADGEWTLTLRSSEDLPAAEGTQQGTGPAVLRLTEPGSQVRVTYTPAGPDDQLTARLVSSEQSMNFGADMAMEQTYPVPMPGVISLDTAGGWTVQVEP